MSILWKMALSLGIALPITAYVLGSLVATADEPPQRAPIVIRDAGSATPSSSPTDDGRKQNDDDGRVDVVVPSPDDVDDSGDDRGRDDDHGDDGGDDDNSGPGGGDDDSSGHGSGDDDDDSSGHGSGDDD